MNNSNQLSQLRNIVADRINRQHEFSSVSVCNQLRTYARKVGQIVNIRSVENALMDMYNLGLMSDYRMTGSADVLRFSPGLNKSLNQKLKLDKRNRLFVNANVIANIGVSSYGYVYVTKEPHRLLLSNAPLGTDSKAYSVDCYNNVKITVPQSKKTWRARYLSNGIAEVVSF